MNGGPLASDAKRTSVLRRVTAADCTHYIAAAGREGDVCAFALSADASPLVVEAISGRSLVVAPGDVFLATPGHRESTRWVVGGVPDGGLLPDRDYTVLADAGIVGDLVGDFSRAKAHLGLVRYLGVVPQSDGQALNIRQFALRPGDNQADRATSLFVIVGTSAEVGKTTAGIAITRTLRRGGLSNIMMLKATGTSSVNELLAYLDFGVAQAFDCVDFGLPTTYPSGRTGIDGVFADALDYCLSLPAEALLIECGGDVLGANVPSFLKALTTRRTEAKVILAASDALAALGGTRTLKEMGVNVNIVTGLCTETPTLRQRTEDLCQVPAVNMARGGSDSIAL